jgi:hypothetical protein
MTNWGMNLNPLVDLPFWISDKYISKIILILDIVISQDGGCSLSRSDEMRVKAHIVKLFSNILDSWRKLTDPYAIRL